MLIIGRIGVALIGGAAVVFSAWALVSSLTDPNGGRTWLLYGLAFAASLVGTVAGAMGRARGATLVAAIYGAAGVVLLWLSGWRIQPISILLLVASVFVLAVAVALRRARAAE